MKQNIKKIKELSFFIGIIILTIIRLIQDSAIFDLSDITVDIIKIIALMFFLIKLAFQKYERKEIIGISVIIVVSTAITVIARVPMILMTAIALIGIKDIDIKKVIKVIFYTTLTITVINAIFFLINLATNPANIETLNSWNRNNRYYLYFKHPNTLAAVILGLLMEWLYLYSARYSKTIIFIIEVLAAIIMYALTKSRTILIVFIILIFLRLMIDINKKSINTIIRVMGKYLFVILCLINILFLFFYNNFNKKQLQKMDDIFSGRVSFSIMAIEEYGLTLLPQYIDYDEVNNNQKLILDSFYVHFAINYGVISLIILSILILKASRNATRLEILYIIIFNVLGFCEMTGFDITICISLIIVADKLLNSKSNKQEDLISVIVPVYNVDKYIKECVDSIINQTYKNIEIILINDGSTDSSDKICKELAEKDKRINFITQKNLGVGAARNRGLEIANGNYITFVDSDDTINPKYIEKLYKLSKENNVSLSITGAFFCNGKDKPANQYIETKCAYEDIMSYMLDERYFSSSIWGKLYRRDLWKNIRFSVNTKIGEDLEVLTTLLERIDYAYIDTYELNYNYRVNRIGSAVESEFDENWKKEIEICNQIINKFKNENKKILQYAIKRYIRINYTCIMKILKSNRFDRDEYENLRNNILDYKKDNIYKKFPLIQKIKIWLVLYKVETVIKMFNHNRIR